MAFDAEVLILSERLPAALLDRLRKTFRCHGPFGERELAACLAERGALVRGVATNGSTPFDEGMIARLPALEIVACYSAGTDRIDVAALTARSIRLTTASPVLAGEVADLAIALMLMARRRLHVADRFVRDGRWTQGAFPLGAASNGRRLGLLGLGHIGALIARRGAAMNMSIAYCTRTPVEGSAYTYHPTPLALARAVDVFVIACPGGPARRHLVGKDVIDAVGPQGTIVNIARGEIVDEVELIAALSSGRLGSAGLDVFEREPTAAEALREMPNVALTPHLGSATVETRQAMEDAVVDALTKQLLREMP